MKKFVLEGWDALFREGGAESADNVPNLWGEAIMANLALIDPQKSWEVFARKDWDGQ